MALLSSLRQFGGLVRLSHTIFGLPFTFAAAALAHAAATEGKLVAATEGLTGAKMLWIILAFTGARTAAMGFNRIVDRKIDAKNPRTAERELPAGKITLAAVSVFTGLSVLVFLGSTWALGGVALALSPLCLLVIFAYSLFKRFSWASHLILGIALAMGPAGAWVAVTGNLHSFATPTILMIAVASWVAGFDILYSLQDEQFDRSVGLHSIPVTFGTRGAVLLSAALHVVTAGALLCVHVAEDLGAWHLGGVALVSTILVYEHWIVGPGRLNRINRAFFDLNGYVSIAYLVCVLLDVFV